MKKLVEPRTFGPISAVFLAAALGCGGGGGGDGGSDTGSQTRALTVWTGNVVSLEEPTVFDPGPPVAGCTNGDLGLQACVFTRASSSGPEFTSCSPVDPTSCTFRLQAPPQQADGDQWFFYFCADQGFDGCDGPAAFPPLPAELEFTSICRGDRFEIVDAAVDFGTTTYASFTRTADGCPGTDRSTRSDFPG